MPALDRSNVSRALIGGSLIAVLFAVKGCALSFDDYPVGDLCAASADAGFRPSTAPDPALRGCDAGTSTTDDDRAAAGASGADGST